MVMKQKSTVEKEEKKRRVTVGKLKLSRETVKDLTGGEQKEIKGGRGGRDYDTKLVGCTPTAGC